MSKLSISESGLISGCPVLFPVSEYGITIHKAPILGVISNHFFFLLPSIANHLLLHVHLLLLVHYFLSNLLSLHHHCWLLIQPSWFPRGIISRRIPSASSLPHLQAARARPSKWKYKYGASWVTAYRGMSVTIKSNFHMNVGKIFHRYDDLEIISSGMFATNLLCNYLKNDKSIYKWSMAMAQFLFLSNMQETERDSYLFMYLYIGFSLQPNLLFSCLDLRWNFY